MFGIIEYKIGGYIMAKKMKIASGIAKGTVGCLAFGCNLVINSAFKVATGGFGAPSGSVTTIDEAKKLSKYWFEEAKKDFSESKK